jgi:Family of unknown function (DUF5675)
MKNTMELELIRTYFPLGTNGDIFYEGSRICSSIELPWRNNTHCISCIPEGRYELAGRHTERFGRHFILKDVPNRSMILIHPANDALKELKGCIAPVTMLIAEGKGSSSRKALARLGTLVDPELESGNPVYLTIKSLTHEFSSKNYLSDT